MNYNKTQLYPQEAFEKHVFNRDQFAHFLRWSYVLKLCSKKKWKILDFGCGSAGLLETLYRNKHSPKVYLGLDIRKRQIKLNKEKFKLKFAEFKAVDLCKKVNERTDWDLIVSFETIEHVGKKNVNKFLQNIRQHMSKSTLLLISTPIFDSKTGAAKNHIIGGKVGELTYEQMYNALTRNGLTVIKNYATFASQKDYIHELNSWQKMAFERLSEYYDAATLSALIAPMLLDASMGRNCLWYCKLK